ncbi:hypothetical protein PPL_00754 [Heterostelium album PN500]|uniref:Uncharacterized protein n=1 Tax=Heterostelium pallidum (strain ATCC 26659 / Pp 5 / PN500) TaxID=670386 RepID=D3AXC3_HETP5|nr:hypothetical protein PPL_00754 [Heterostelium album PN500]EFA86192.1 hypothetical protein PPL_00754 [Heterostelium album PN500]|eukprot:XP_020438297.1 hypothetical protein PPL_00754 [Heterostelium album PN500]
MQNNNVIPYAVVAADPTIIPGVNNRLQVLNTFDQTIHLLIRSDKAFKQYPHNLTANAQYGSVEANDTIVFEVSSDDSHVSVFITENQRYYNVLFDRQVSKGNCLRFKQSHIKLARERLPRYFNAQFEEIIEAVPAANNVAPPVNNFVAANHIETGAEDINNVEHLVVRETAEAGKNMANNLQAAVVIPDPTIVPGEVMRLQILNTTNRPVHVLIRPRSAHEQFPKQLDELAQYGAVAGNNTATTYEVHSPESFVSVFVIAQNGFYLLVIKNRQINRASSNFKTLIYIDVIVSKDAYKDKTKTDKSKVVEHSGKVKKIITSRQTKRRDTQHLSRLPNQIIYS